jgi:hypothetical protein
MQQNCWGIQLVANQLPAGTNPIKWLDLTEIDGNNQAPQQGQQPVGAGNGAEGGNGGGGGVALAVGSVRLRSNVEVVIKPCPHCQKYKNVLCGHGETAAREAGLLLWSEVAVDMIGPWTIDKTEKFSTLTIIDLVTNLVEIVHVMNKTSAAITAHFVNVWLTCYQNS